MPEKTVVVKFSTIEKICHQSIADVKAALCSKSFKKLALASVILEELELATTGTACEDEWKHIKDRA